MDTFNHETTFADGSVTSVELPKGIDPDLYDETCRELDSASAAGQAAGRRAAESRLRLAVQLQEQSSDLAAMSWKQLVQAPAYQVQVTRVNAKYASTKQAASNQLVELRENPAELRKVLAGLGIVTDLDATVKRWELDPNRPKTTGAATHVTKTSVSTGPELVDAGDFTDSDGSLFGLMDANDDRLAMATPKDLGKNLGEALNRANKHLLAAEAFKAFVVRSMRGF